MLFSGPLKEEEATALYKGNFFRPEHVFRIVDANNAETFTSIGSFVWPHPNFWNDVIFPILVLVY